MDSPSGSAELNTDAKKKAVKRGSGVYVPPHAREDRSPMINTSQQKKIVKSPTVKNGSDSTSVELSSSKSSGTLIRVLSGGVASKKRNSTDEAPPSNEQTEKPEGAPSSGKPCDQSSPKKSKTGSINAHEIAKTRIKRKADRIPFLRKVLPLASAEEAEAPPKPVKSPVGPVTRSQAKPKYENIAEALQQFCGNKTRNQTISTNVERRANGPESVTKTSTTVKPVDPKVEVQKKAASPPNKVPLEQLISLADSPPATLKAEGKQIAPAQESSSGIQRPLRTSTMRVKPAEQANWRDQLGKPKAGQSEPSYNKTDNVSCDRRSMNTRPPVASAGQNLQGNNCAHPRSKTVPTKMTAWNKNDSSKLTVERRKSSSQGCCVEEELDADFRSLLSLKKDSSNEQYIDSHCHLDFLWHRLKGGNLEKWMEMYPEAFPSNFAGCIPNFIKPEIFVRHDELSGFDRDWIYSEVQNKYVLGASYGVHPHFSAGYDEIIEEGIREMLVDRNNTKAVAVGECGLDYFKSDTTPEDQIASFESQLRLAVEQHLPVIIHCRGSRAKPDEAEMQCLEIMERILPKDRTVHRHCFTRSWKIAQIWLQAFPNTYFGFTSSIAMKGSDLSAVRNLPLEKIILETDAPYFRPSNFVGPKTGPGKLSFPGMAIAVSDVIATERKMSVNEVLAVTRKNTINCYNLPSP